MPQISVVMSVYKEDVIGIKRSIDSILFQTFKDFEFIIIVDYPHNLEAITLIESYSNQDSRVKYIIHEKNKGLATGLNEGIRMATGKYIARQDTEDTSHLDRFQVQYDYMETHTEVDILGTAQKYVDHEGKLILLREYKALVGKEIKRNSPLGHPTTLIRRETFFKYGFYKEDLYCEDYDLWINWYFKGVVFHNLKECYYDYYQDDAYKVKKAKSELKDTIDCKSKYTKQLDFNTSDYLYLYFQKIVLLFPASIIVRLFYLFVKFTQSSRN
jgi:glycosyltransferase involved in cell wall biosynthesis